MKLLKRISEDEVIAEFLKAEINSKRFRKSILDALGNDNSSFITNPDISNAEENRLRKNLLGEVRGFGNNRKLFENFPSDVAWYNSVISKDELHHVMYIDYSYWNELTNHTRLPINASSNILNNVEVFGVSNAGFKEIYSEIQMGKTFPKLIFVSCNEKSRIVVLEGHARLTSYFLDKQYIPGEMEVIVGYSEGFADWDLY